jgi:mRNA interferase HigB
MSHRSPVTEPQNSEFGRATISCVASQIGKSYNASVNVVARKDLEAFWLRDPETEQPLRAWLITAKTRNWTSLSDVTRTFSKASPVNAERCVFDIHGGDYRLIVAFRFSARVAFIKFIGTHARYDRVDAATVSEF